MRQETIDAFWQHYVDSLPAGAASSPLPAAWSFGDTPTLADALAALVAAGVKTATCSSLEEMALDGEPLPQPGDHAIVLDGNGTPVCVIETVEVRVIRFDEVDAQFAFDEGEGDRSLAYWREAHRSFFGRTMPGKGLAFREEMPLLCERFRLVFPP